MSLHVSTAHNASQDTSSATAGSGRARSLDAMRTSEGTFTGAGSGPQIAWRSWTPEDPRSVVVVAHGAGEHMGRYEHVVAALTAAGVAVHALDHRGHGISEGARGVVDRLRHAADDVAALVDRAVAAHPGLPVVLLGHSMGGTIALLHALDRPAPLAGLVLSAPALTLGSGPLPLRLLARTRVLPLLLSAVRPELGMLQLDPQGISSDPDEVAAYEADPLVFHGPLPARTTVEIAEFILGPFRKRTGELQLPLLVMHGVDDPITPCEASETVYVMAGSADKTLKRYPGAFHELFNEAPATRDYALAELLGWLTEHR